MELYSTHNHGFSFYPYPLQYYYYYHYSNPPQNYVHWSQNPDSHLYSVDLPGLEKKEIRVELEDSRYLVIRTEDDDAESSSMRRFMKKFRLPRMVDVDAISAAYEHGVLTVRVPRMLPSVQPAADESGNSVARAA